MAYWGSSVADADFPAGTVGVYILQIKKRMFEEANAVVEKKHPEQSILASLRCIRLLNSAFPKNRSVHFGKKDFAKAIALFDEWYDAMSGKIPKKYRQGVRDEADAEFARFAMEVFGLSEAPEAS